MIISLKWFFRLRITRRATTISFDIQLTMILRNRHRTRILSDLFEAKLDHRSSDLSVLATPASFMTKVKLIGLLKAEMRE